MKFLISRPDKIGDVVLALHGVKELKNILPESQVYIHAAEYTAKLVENIDFIDGCVRFEEDLVPHRFDAVVDLMAKPYTAWSYYRAGIPVRIGNSARWFRALYTDKKYIRRSHALMNEAEYNWQLIRLLHPKLKNLPLISSLRAEDFKHIVPFSSERPYFICMPGVSVSAEAWPLSSWVELGKLCAEKYPGHDMHFLIGPAEKSQANKLESLLSEIPSAKLLQLPDLAHVLGALRGAKAYVGPSTGITHLASAIGIPGVGIYPKRKSMHPRRWGPFRSSLTLLSPASEISAQRVLEALPEPGFKDSEESVTDSQSPPLLSAFVICKNEEKNIRRCLESIKWCDEILIVDSGSSDQTLDICREYPRVKIIERHWPGHREQKQFALEQCQGEWVLNLDADEELSLELKSEIQRILHLPESERKAVDGYYLCRVVYFLSTWWDRGGWFPEYRMRFFKRAKAHWGWINPHEKAIVEGRRKKLRGHLFHFTSSGIGDYVATLNRFSQNSAQALFDSGLRSSLFRIVFHPLFRFFKFFIIKRGFLEGTLGFIMACSEAFYTFLTYAKLWELQHREENAHTERPELHELLKKNEKEREDREPSSGFLDEEGSTRQVSL